MDSGGKFSKVKGDNNDDCQIFIPFLRSRLDVINTSVYLLEDCFKNGDENAKKYLKKINEELETIRKFINM